MKEQDKMKESIDNSRFLLKRLKERQPFKDFSAHDKALASAENLYELLIEAGLFQRSGQ